ncbi:MAG: transcriptional repressor [Pseudomonadota bacterium]
MKLDIDPIKKAGLRTTQARVQILELLETHGEQHLSAEEIFRMMSDRGKQVALATVYRVLTQFEAAGIVARLRLNDNHSVFELSRPDHHDHMVSLDTGEVMEFSDEIIEARQTKICEERGYELVDRSLVLYVRDNDS